MRCIPSVAGAVAIVVALNGSVGAEPVHLADGDSFKLGSQRYRLSGIDAPELHQHCTYPSGETWPCGVRARSELRRIIGTYPVTCKAISTDRFGRILASCRAGGRDLAEEMVRAGYATSSARFGFFNPYERAEAQARADKRGLWAGTFEMPLEWRRSNPRDDDTVAAVVTPRDWLGHKLTEARQMLASWLRAMSGR